MSRILMEACCGSADDCIRVARAGVDRIELNSALFLGGLTPSAGTLMEALSNVPDIPILVMLRPRTGGFHYTETEYRSMCRDAELLMKAGAAGLVFGPLTTDGMPDAVQVRTLVEIADGHPTIFHRAIDICPDWHRGMDILMESGVTRILTSGQRRTALEGSETIRYMREYGNGRIEILPAGGIRLENVAEVIRKTGCTQIHFARHTEYPDSSMRNAGEITFNGHEAPENRYRISDAAYYQEMRGVLENAQIA